MKPTPRNGFGVSYPHPHLPENICLKNLPLPRKSFKKNYSSPPCPRRWGRGGRCGISEKCRNIGEVKKNSFAGKRRSIIGFLASEPKERAYIFLFSDSALQQYAQCFSENKREGEITFGLSRTCSQVRRNNTRHVWTKKTRSNTYCIFPQKK